MSMKTALVFLGLIFVSRDTSRCVLSMEPSRYNVLSNKIMAVNLELSLIRSEQEKINRQLDIVNSEPKVSCQESHQGNGEKFEQNITDSFCTTKVDFYVGLLKSAFQDEKKYLRETTSKLEHTTQFLNIKANASDKEIHKLVHVQKEIKNDHKLLEKKMNNAAEHLQQKLEMVPQILNSLQEKVKGLETGILGNSEKISNSETTLNSIRNYFTLRLDEELKSIRQEISILMQEQEGCLSGNDVGVYSFPPTSYMYPHVAMVTFERPFKNIPVIVHGLSVIDSGHWTNLRLSSSITEVTRSYFKLTVNTWADTTLYGAKFSWMACPK